MNTRDFIESVANGTAKKPRNGTRYVSSVMYDGERLFSYGSHYPLLFKVGTYWVCNDRGYSNTTAKHISHARQYADFCVHLPRNSSLTTPAQIASAARVEIKENEDMILDALERQIKRPRYEATYQKSIERAEARIEQLKALIVAAEAVI